MASEEEKRERILAFLAPSPKKAIDVAKHLSVERSEANRLLYEMERKNKVKKRGSNQWEICCGSADAGGGKKNPALTNACTAIATIKSTALCEKAGTSVMATTQLTELEQNIIAFMKGNGGKGSALEIAKGVGKETTKDINSSLYSLKQKSCLVHDERNKQWLMKGREPSSGDAEGETQGSVGDPSRKQPPNRPAQWGRQAQNQAAPFRQRAWNQTALFGQQARDQAHPSWQQACYKAVPFRNQARDQVAQFRQQAQTQPTHSLQQAQNQTTPLGQQSQDQATISVNQPQTHAAHSCQPECNQAGKPGQQAWKEALQSEKQEQHQTALSEKQAESQPAPSGKKVEKQAAPSEKQSQNHRGPLLHTQNSHNQAAPAGPQSLNQAQIKQQDHNLVTPTGQQAQNQAVPSVTQEKNQLAPQGQQSENDEGLSGHQPLNQASQSGQQVENQEAPLGEKANSRTETSGKQAQNQSVTEQDGLTNMEGEEKTREQMESLPPQATTELYAYSEAANANPDHNYTRPTPPGSPLTGPSDDTSIVSLQHKQYVALCDMRNHLERQTAAVESLRKAEQMQTALIRKKLAVSKQQATATKDLAVAMTSCALQMQVVSRRLQQGNAILTAGQACTTQKIQDIMEQIIQLLGQKHSQMQPVGSETLASCSSTPSSMPCTPQPSPSPPGQGINKGRGQRKQVQDLCGVASKRKK